MNMLEVIADENNPKYKDYLDWLGGDFDPEEFDLKEVNYRLGVIE